MQITHCKLKRSIQHTLVEYFVLESAARSAADLLNINSNSTTVFYRKIRQVICCYLSSAANEVLPAMWIDKSYFGGVRNGKQGREVVGNVTGAY